MNETKKPTPPAISRPRKVLLHMVPFGGDWAGKATCLDTQKEFKFRDMNELVLWLNADCPEPQQSTEDAPQKVEVLTENDN